MSYTTPHGVVVPAITAAQMREIDRIAVEEFGLGVLQMMENAGRNLAGNALEMLDRAGEVIILAGGGGNGGGGLCCARHLHNRHIPVRVILDRAVARLSAPARTQWRTVVAAGVLVASVDQASDLLDHAALIIDALIGYGLTAAPRGDTATLIRCCDRAQTLVLSLDVPSGRDATTGHAPGDVIVPHRTLTLALPKTGLLVDAGELVLADIGIPPAVYARLSIRVGEYFGAGYWTPVRRASPPPG